MSLPEIDFQKIRLHNGGREKAFEELCSQLAYLDEEAKNGTFYRKGAGSDAGVECFSVFADGTETGWQVKYYWEFATSLIGSLDDSIKTALAKHPTLTRYIVCIPFNLSDSRTGRGKTPLAKWEDWCRKWLDLAAKSGRNLTIDLWSQSILSERLLRNSALHSGRLRYWFEIERLTPEWFEARFQRAKSDLGDRYTVQSSVDLAVREVLFGLAHNENVMSRVADVAQSLTDKGQKALKAASGTLSAGETSTELNTFASALTDLPAAARKTQRKSATDRLVRDWLGVLTRTFNDCDAVMDWLGTRSPGSAASRDLISFRDSLVAAVAEFKSKRWQLVDRDRMLLVGEGGAGKSHLLADVVSHQLANGLPAIMLLGQYFVDGEIWPQLMAALGLPATWTGDDFLGALDAAAQAKGVRALLVLDALNERSGVNVWSPRLGGFLTDFDKFPNVAVVLSCRTTYVNHVIPGNLDAEVLPRITHAGFSASDAKAYLTARRVLLAAVPRPAHELKNPLFLKTCCDYLLRSGATEFPHDLIGTSRVYDFYLTAVSDSVTRRLGLAPRRRIIESAVQRLASEMASTNSERVELGRAYELYDPLLASGSELENDIVTQLESEGLISVEIDSGEDAGRPEHVRFTFQRLSDYLIASELLAGCKTAADLKTVLTGTGAAAKYLKHPLIYERAGVVEALALLSVERHRTELPDLIDEADWWRLESVFRSSLLWRDQALFTDRTLELVEAILGEDQRLPVILSVATEPGNRYNADYLHAELIGHSMPKRDATWSIPLAEVAYERENSAFELIDWALTWGRDSIQEKRAELTATALTWFLSTSYRALRDRATKALVALLAPRGLLANQLFLKFWTSVDDDYLRERLLASIYGAMLQGGLSHDDLKLLAQTAYDALYKIGPLPINCLIRDHGLGIIEYCLYRGCIPSDVDLGEVRAPRKSGWPLELVFDSTIESFKERYRSGSGPDRIVGSAVSDGDFARYVIDRNSAQWSPASIGTTVLPNAYQLAMDWRSQVTAREGAPVSNAIDALFDVAKGVRDQAAWQKTPEREALSNAELKLRDDGGPIVWEEYRVNAQSWVRSGAITEQRTPARFDGGWARRWVCKRAHDLGWSEKLHGEFDSSSVISSDRMAHAVERIGKKYQWLALFELRARLADNCAYIGGWSTGEEHDCYRDEIHDGVRDIDPSLLLKRSTGSETSYKGPGCWWSPIAPKLDSSDPVNLMQWLYGERDFINDLSCIDVDDNQGNRWLVLRSFRMTSDDSDDISALRGDSWSRISSLVVRKRVLKQVLKKLTGVLLQDPDSIQVRNIGGRGYYLGEHPWRSGPVGNDETIKKGSGISSLPFSFKPTVVDYLCEHGNNDYSIEQSVSTDLPASWLLTALDIRSAGGAGISYVDDTRTTRFFDPAVIEEGPQAALVDRTLFLERMKAADLVPIWVIAGEKSVIGQPHDKGGYGGRRTFTSVYWLDGDTWQRMDHEDFEYPTKAQVDGIFGGTAPTWVKTAP